MDQSASMSKNISAATPKAPPNRARFRSDKLSLYALGIFVTVNLIAARYSPIQDCDETFNYWEPTHYLIHGYGLQTWEYSPVYAIRSWLYIVVHGMIGWSRRPLPFYSKVEEFYTVRSVLAIVCALCQHRLYSAISKQCNARVANIFLVALVSSPGMFPASVAYLPSSFAMYTTMLGMANFMDEPSRNNTISGIVYFAMGSVIGWPFAAVLILPYLLEQCLGEIVKASLRGDSRYPKMLATWSIGAAWACLVLLADVATNTYFFRRFVVVPLNMVVYNVFSSSDKGPSIFGTSPWHFYLRNLVLNFNIWLVLALAALPALVLQRTWIYIRRSKIPPRPDVPLEPWSDIRRAILLLPFNLWLVIFTLQPHKEERFMYPAYPCLCYNAAAALHGLLVSLGHMTPDTLLGRIPAKMKALAIALVIAGSINIGLARTYGNYSAYSGPMKIYTLLHAERYANIEANVCFGKDWYRFPTSFFLPNHMRAKFIKNEFEGLLPGEFAEDVDAAQRRPGTWMIPVGMNDENEEDPGKYIPLGQCDFLVDTRFPSRPASSIEPDFALDTKRWQSIHCSPYLDTDATSLIGRLIWLPNSPLVPNFLARRWGEHCLLRQKQREKSAT